MIYTRKWARENYHEPMAELRAVLSEHEHPTRQDDSSGPCLIA
jgi:hypothetical protein